jgi:DNA repair exonuclease SbcCD ATPase subunit
MPIISTEIIFWTQVGSIIAFLAALFVLYRLLVDQKDATIQLQKENISYLKDQLADAKAQSPDVLAQSLTNRVNQFEGELRRLEQDKTATKEQIGAKEAELTATRAEAETLTKQIVNARTLLKDFLCPTCGAPLAEKAYHFESAEYQGREVDVDHEYMAFECGYEVVDGKVRSLCKTTNTGPVS